MNALSKELEESKLPNEDGQEIWAGCPASDLFGFGDLVAEVTPATAEQVHVWLKQEQEARMHDWHRYRALLDAAHNAIKGTGMEELAGVLIHLRDPRWKPNAERSNPADSAGGKQRKDLNEN